MGFIAGEPGIGKTALMDTFVAHLSTTENVWVGHGQCIDHYGAGEAYLPSPGSPGTPLSGTGGATNS